MTLLLVLAALLVVAVLAPFRGVDSRGLTDRDGGPPDLPPPDGRRHRQGAAR